MSTKEPTTSTAPTLTARESELLAGAMKCTKGEVVIDYKLFAARFGFKDSNSAKASWHSLKKKLDKLDNTPASTSTPVENGSVSPTKGKKRTKTEDDNEGDETLQDGSPAPVAKKGKRGGRKAKTEVEKEGAKEDGTVNKAKTAKSSVKVEAEDEI